MTTHCHSSHRYFTFTPRVHITLLALFATILFFTLGTWQLQRANEKKIREQQSSIEEKKRPTPFFTHPNQYQRLQMKGRYLNKTLLFDNQHEQHQLGYHVLTPFLLNDNTLLIIDRGWIPKNTTTQLDVPATAMTITGVAYYPSTKQWVLGEALDIKSPQLAIVQTLDSKLFNRFLQKSVYPFIIRLDAQETHGFIRHWIVNNMPWQRHIAYAIQWFIFGVIVIIIYLVRNIKYEKK